MTANPMPPFDLRARAHQAMLDNGFTPDMTPDVAAQVRQLTQPADTPAASNARDLRHLLWSSIDNDNSRDLDQIEVAETLADGAIRVLVGIADVDASVPDGSPIDRHARANGVTVYTGVETFPMLPEELSTGLTSLLEDQPRLAIIIDMTVDAKGTVTASDVYPALTQNRARLTYNAVGAWLDGQAPIPPPVAQVAGLEDQIRLQHEAAQRIHAYRQEQGALEFETVEAMPVTQNGNVVDLTVNRKNAASSLIENFMVAANTTMATFLEARKVASLQRVVRAPQRWDRIVEIARQFGDTLPPTPDSRALADFLTRRKAADPDHFPDLSLSIVKLLGPGEYAVVDDPSDPQGHFGLAAYRYTHSTAPNRRYPDLIIQRLLKAVVHQTPPPYSLDALNAIAAQCNLRDAAARKVERLMRKVIAAVLLSTHIGQEYDAIVTGATPKGTFVRLLAPPVEGRVVRYEAGLDVGDKLRVRLLSTDAERGFIDFARE